MGIVLNNALLVDLDPIGVESGGLRIDGHQIAARGVVTAQPGDEEIDCRGAVVLPGFVNGHTHLYSALAVGMPAPPRVPTSFLEILQLVWWRLDRAHNEESSAMSARIGALDAVRSGTTTLIDHHASPNAIAGSLDRIERGISDVGLRGVLCYEITDRHGKPGRDAGVEESRRYAGKCALAKNGRFAALIGAHAMFTLDDATLEEIEDWADEFAIGVHIHVAEDPCDEAISIRQYGAPLLDRLERHRLLHTRNIFGHCIHLSDVAIARINEAKVTIAHNPRSNMNNAVGYAPLAKLKAPIMLGTDGIGADMLAEARHAWFKSRDGGAGIAPVDVIGMLVASARRASRSLGVTLGKLSVNAAADVVVTDYVPFTELTTQNLPGHLLFGFDSRHVRDVIVDGRVVMRDRVIKTLDEAAIRREAVSVTKSLWKRLDAIAP